ncbi:hypothetical protein [Streptosporangium sp. H16]|uniref:hypothetical protein n=1 Tax=Streptosporangium sp. H16 TaxID=3444184 RepID=UPI003F7AF80B
MTVDIDCAATALQRLDEQPEHMVMILRSRRTRPDTARTAFVDVPEVSWSTFAARAGHTAGHTAGHGGADGGVS